MMAMKTILITALIVVAGPVAPALAADAAPASCEGRHQIKSKSRPLFESKALMPSLLLLQGQGEAKFHLDAAPPVALCLAERYEVAGTPVDASFAAHEAGEKTLNWRFTTPDARSIVVFYEGAVALMAKKTVFFVAEERDGKIGYYAMFRDPPTLAALKPIVAGILDGSAKPLAQVRWPAGNKEPVIDAYDTQRLK
jgi:hypothetical protein